MELSTARYNEIYFNFLSELLNHKTVFWDDDLIRIGMKYVFENLLELSNSGWTVYYDKVGNIIAYNINHDLNSSFLYLCAHIDTVGANKDEWVSDPFKPFETPSHIAGRGANDCKAGVAFILLVSNLIKDNIINNLNLGFIITFREEGNKGKTSSSIPFGELPFSNLTNYIICLENTVKLNINTGKHALGIYQREPHNLFITIKGTIKDLSHLLKLNLLESGWKPVVITPMYPPNDEMLIEEITNQYPGHISTLKNENNLLLKEITNPDNYNKSICFGNKNETSVVDSVLFLYSVPGMEHELILNYRGYLQIEKIKEALQNLNYSETFSFMHGFGADLINNKNKQIIEKRFGKQLDELQINFEDNPGRSDASSICNNLPNNLKSNVIPFACGPGCRTHTHDGIKRSTHGPNEGFYKPVASIVIPTLLQFIQTFK